MRRTLFLIPHEIAGIPVFGVGWLLFGLVLLLLVRLGLARSAGKPLSATLVSEGPLWLIAAAVVGLLLPQAELKNLAGEPIGMAIRGYGVFLLVAIGSAVVLAGYRVQRRGIAADVIYNLAPWTFIGGILGARLFYVVQYYSTFQGETSLETIRNMLMFTEGGLVVYGGILGGFAASAYYLLRHRLPLLTLGDVIVPCIFLGIFFGRIGCLMNGCCYGGRCPEGPTAIHFPPGSPVYQEQLVSGELLGMEIDPDGRKVNEVRAESLAAEAGIEAGERVDAVELVADAPAVSPSSLPAEAVNPGISVTVGGKRYRWSPDSLPSASLPVQPAQVISSLSALGMFLILLVVERWIQRPGALLALGFAGYAIVRFLLEIVRVDEGGRFGTELSISQWVSILVLLAATIGLVWIYRRSPQSQSTSASAT